MTSQAEPTRADLYARVTNLNRLLGQMGAFFAIFRSWRAFSSGSTLIAARDAGRACV